MSTFIASAITIPLAALLTDTLVPYFLSIAIGDLSAGNFSDIQSQLWLAGGVGVVGVICNLAGFQLLTTHESMVTKSLRESTLSALLAKDHNFFINQKIGGLTGKFIDFTNAHISLQDTIIIETLRFILSFGIGLTIIFWHAPILGIILLILMTGLLYQVRLSLKLRKDARHARKEMVAVLNGAVADIVTNNQTVKTFAQDDQEMSKVAKLGRKYQQLYRRDYRWMSAEGSGRLLLSIIMQIVAVAILVSLVSQGLVSVAIAVFTVAYLQRLSSQIFSLGEMINGFDRIFLQAAPMTEILSVGPEITDIRHAKNLQVSAGVIQFDHMTYKYPDAATPAISDLNLTIPDGQKIGIVGRSGAGKTTLTKLLLRFDDPSSGTISIDRQDIAKVRQKSLRQNISFVPQEPLLFHRSLRENIAYGKIDATDAEILEAARKANATEFIDNLPNGLDTIVGERGVKLSGGQRQRVAIARAILKDAPILILDEATSALDSESEKLIQDALGNLTAGRTSIVIAHRLSTIAKMDRIVVVDQGEVVEDGTHRSLIAAGGIYAKLWRHQSGGFIDE